MHEMNAAVTSPRRSVGASSLISAWAPRKARPWPAPPSSALAKSAASECSGKASTGAGRPRAQAARDERRPERLETGAAVVARGEQLRGARGGEQRAGDRAEQREVARVQEVGGVAGRDREGERRRDA